MHRMISWTPVCLRNLSDSHFLYPLINCPIIWVLKDQSLCRNPHNKKSLLAAQKTFITDVDVALDNIKEWTKSMSYPSSMTEHTDNASFLAGIIPYHKNEEILLELSKHFTAMIYDKSSYYERKSSKHLTPSLSFAAKFQSALRKEKTFFVSHVDEIRKKSEHFDLLRYSCVRK